MTRVSVAMASADKRCSPMSLLAFAVVLGIRRKREDGEEGGRRRSGQVARSVNQQAQ